ncbi:MAG: EAL domain-containing protein [Lachnospiraceae bacterium]|nr:EAL domain-containing protein [Lachnospiraceae bacterium]
MVWNVQFQFAGLVLVLVVASMSLAQRRLNFAAEKAFIRLLFSVTLSIIFDIASVFAINYRATIGLNATEIICKAYLYTIVGVAYSSATFSAAEIKHVIDSSLEKLLFVPLVIQVVSLVVFPIGIHVSEGELYTEGIPVMMTYALCVLYLIGSLLTVLILHRDINTKARASIYFWMICWMLAALIQFLNNQLLIVSFAMSLACVYMYCKLENPEYRLDYATNVFNGKAFSAILTEHIKKREKKAIITFVITDAGRVNEIFGNKATETIVRSLSKFTDNVPHASLFRLEDNVFSVITNTGDPAENALEVYSSRFSQPWAVGEATVEVNASFSYIDDVSKYEDEDELEEIVHYFAKASTKRISGDILHVNEDELAGRERNIKLKQALEWAFSHDGVEVYYQPIYNIKEGRFNSMEALARIHDEEGNFIMPSDFIVFAEKNGLILKLGEIVFRKVCEFIQRMHVEEYGIDYIEVNLSVVQCMQEDMGRILKNIMGEYQVPPYRINFEITETAIASSKATMDRNMNELINYGSGFSLDDYGSGYSNLSYVINLPLAIIKLDKQMVDSYFTSEKVKITTEYTINMIHKLGMKVVVEGIETEEQFLAFKALGVEYIQGFYFSRPLPRNRVLTFIQEWL